MSAPEEVREEWRRAVVLTFGSSGMFEVDDAENWIEMQRGFASPRGRRHRMNLQSGGGESADPTGAFPGSSDAHVTEAGARAFYHRWVELMTTEDDHA